ncbi:MAG: ATP phosphoribosyltransferase [Candidatus Bathyarchaeia archaeon]|nr:ATP phosphoribosyltransferase [Candidatus Bathyarchaeota archaeon]
MKNCFRVALPSKGRLKTPALKILEEAGLKVKEQERTYILKTSDSEFEVVLARAFDIPLYVQYGAATLGITGHDIILEREADVYEVSDLKFGRCKLVLAAPIEANLSKAIELPLNARIATEFPNLTRKFFNSLGKPIEVLTVRGSAELTPKLGLADAIVDLSTTGETLKKNGLKEVEVILESTARLICNKIAYRSFNKIKEFIERVDEAVKKCEAFS